MRPTSVLAFAPANPRDLPAIGVSPFPMPIQFPIRNAPSPAATASLAIGGEIARRVTSLATG